MTQPGDHTPKIRVETESPISVLPGAIDRHNISVHLLDKLANIDSNVLPIISGGLDKLHEIEPEYSPLRMFEMDVTRRIVLNKATHGIAAPPEEVRRIKHITRPTSNLHVYLQINRTFHDILRVGDKDPEELDDNEIPWMIENPTNALKLARKIAETDLKNDSLEESEFIHAVQQCYFAVLLSGEKSTYQKIYKICLPLFRQMKEKNPMYETILQYLSERTEKLPELAEVLEDDAPKFFKEYGKAAALRDLLAYINLNNVAPVVSKYREGMFEYINKTMLNEDVMRGLAAAYGRSDIFNEPNTPPAIELDWEILPPGSLEDHAKDIVSFYESEGKKSTIDLERLTILEEIRKWWGEDKSYYRKGIRKKRRVIKDDGKEQPDEYILLILQHFDENGEMTHEDAIAESPIAGPNALYVQRYDANHWSWDELMQYPKPDVLAMGARAIRHEAPEGHNLYETMVEKVKKALTISAEDFLAFEFSGIDKQGDIRIRIPRRVLEVMVSDITQIDHQDHLHEAGGDL